MSPSIEERTMNDSTTVMRAARPPVGTGRSPWVAQLAALAMILLGAVGIQEALSRTGIISRPSWIDESLTAVDGVRSDAPWIVAVAVLVALAGLLLLPMALTRRPRKALTLRAGTGVYLRTGDLARIAESVLQGAEAVTATSVRAKRRRLVVTASTVAARDRNSAIVRDVRSRLGPTLDALEKAPRVKVTVKNVGL